MLDLKKRVKADLKGSYGDPIDFWWYKTLKSGSDLSRDIDAHMRSADLGLMMLSTQFLSSDACRRELDHFGARGRHVPIKLAPVHLQDKRVHIPYLTGHVVLPYGDEESYAHCVTEVEKAEFAHLVALDILEHLEELGLI